MDLSHLRSTSQRNLNTFLQHPLSEISGSLGDLGTFLPITLALSSANLISLPATLIFTGIFNILTGCIFGIPLPVQPMKAVAAVALLGSFSAGETQAAGLFVGGCVLFLSVTGLLRWFTDACPIPVVKGIQVGAGLSLMLAAGTSAVAKLGWSRPSWADNYVWLLVAFVVLLVLGSYPRVPFALLLTLLGLILATISLAGQHGHSPSFKWWHPYVQVPLPREWRDGILKAGVGQLPLTTLNSVVAVVHLSGDLLPDIPSPSATSIGWSVALMNFSSCWFGSMPVCHGSGGLAAQHRFGARSGASIVFLGAMKLTIGVFFGETLGSLLHRFPLALLTVMVFGAGLELASVGESLNTVRARDLEKDIDELEQRRRWMTMLTTIGLLLAFKNDAIGFLAGMLCHWSYEVPGLVHRLRAKMAKHSSSPEEESLLPGG